MHLNLPKKNESPQHSISASNNNNTITNDHKTVSSNSSTEGGGTAGSEQQIKYENERLKLALAQRYFYYWIIFHLYI